MSDIDGAGTSEAVSEDTSFDSGPAESNSDTGQNQSGENPTWGRYKETLGEIPYGLVKGYLAEDDRKVQERFQAIHKEYEPLKGFKDLGVTPDQVGQYRQIAEMLDNDPVQFYQMLGQVPAIQEFLGQQGTEEEDDTDDLDPNVDDPRLQTLQEQVEQMQQMLQERDQQAQAAELDAQVDAEVDSYWGQHPELNQQDQAQILTTWNAMVQQAAANGQELPTLDQAGERILAYKQSILSAPRPGASAPQVMPTNGSIPSPNSQVRLGQLSKQDTRNLIAGGLDMLNGNG